jgi:hypothetical protein
MGDCNHVWNLSITTLHTDGRTSYTYECDNCHDTKTEQE